MIMNSRKRHQYEQDQAKKRRGLALLLDVFPEMKKYPADEAGLFAPGSDPKRPLLNVHWRRNICRYYLNAGNAKKK